MWRIELPTNPKSRNVNVIPIEYSNKEKADMPKRGSCQSVVVYNDYLYSFGGWDPG
jgi:hypothetical protein